MSAPNEKWLLAGVRRCVIVTVFLATAEVFARVDDAITWGAPLLSPYTHDRLVMQDSLGFRGRPNYQYQKWRMNNAGFRGPDISPAPIPGVIRVAVMGASETFGLYETQGKEYPARMQVLLDSVAPGRFEVINAALPGMTLPPMIDFFTRVVAPVQPQMLLIYPTPDFYLFNDPQPEVLTPPSFTPPGPIRLGRWSLPADFFVPRLADKGRDALKDLVPNFVVETEREWRLSRVRSAHEPDWVWQSVPESRIALLRRHLERLITVVQAAGVSVVLVSHTNRFVGAPSDTLGRDRRYLVNVMSLYYPRASKRVLLEVDSAANGVIRQLAAEHGTGLVEVEGRIPPDSRHFADYVHFTDAGAEAMAQIMAASVIRLAYDPLRHMNQVVEAMGARLPWIVPPSGAQSAALDSLRNVARRAAR